MLLVFGMLLVTSVGFLAMTNARLKSKRMQLAFECMRCRRMFDQPARKGFPQRCLLCGVLDWNVTREDRSGS